MRTSRRASRTKRSVASERIDDRGRCRIEEDDQIDVGREIQLVRAELAHAEDDPAGAFAGIFRIGQLQLALSMRVEEQEVDCRVDAGVGEDRSAARPSLPHRPRRRDRPARSGNALRASAVRSAIIRLASLTSSARGLAAISLSSASSRCSTVRSNRASSISGRRRAQSRRKSERSKTAPRKSCPFRLCGQVLRQPRQPVFFCG